MSTASGTTSHPRERSGLDHIALHGTEESEQLVTPANREPRPHHRIIEDLDEPVELRLGDAESRVHIVYAIAAVYAAPAGQTVVTLAVPPRRSYRVAADAHGVGVKLIDRSSK